MKIVYHIYFEKYSVISYENPILKLEEKKYSIRNDVTISD